MTDTKKKALSFPLRLPLTVRAELETRSHAEGMSLNQFIVMAVAEKIVRIDNQQLVDGESNPFSAILHEQSVSPTS